MANEESVTSIRKVFQYPREDVICLGVAELIEEIETSGQIKDNFSSLK